MSAGTKLKVLRLQAKKTQQQAADEMKITKSALAMYERDERVPRDEVKVVIAKYYGESIESLFYGA